MFLALDAGRAQFLRKWHTACLILVEKSRSLCSEQVSVNDKFSVFRDDNVD